MVVLPDFATISLRQSIIALAARLRLPAVYPFKYFATMGGLVSYGVDQVEQSRLAASYVNRILKGEKPGDCLALELAFYVACSSSHCVFNLTAKVFGIPHNAIFIHWRTPNEISGPQLLEWKLGSLRRGKPASGENLRYQIRKAIMLLGRGVIARLAESAQHPSDLGVIARLGERV